MYTQVLSARVLGVIDTLNCHYERSEVITSSVVLRLLRRSSSLRDANEIAITGIQSDRTTSS
ncbi:hypothetical protein ACOWPH_21670 [Anabaena sp. PCC 7938]|uniref:hypothetical protein n=1 Tax=Anabaena sp. PCC 7938 TaxID=1296340 RepID=UPI003BEED49C